MMRRRFFMMANRHAGRGRHDLAMQVCEALRLAGGEVVHGAAIGEAEAQAEARDVAGRRSADAIIAAGGDGTIRLAAKAVAGTDVALGVVALGTGNVLAHEIGLPRQPLALARLLLDGPARSLRLATANGEPFLLMTGVGFDGRVIAALDQQAKQRIGKLAYVPPLIMALGAGADRLHVDIDGVESETAWLIVARASRYGGRFLLTRQSSFVDGRLAALSFNAVSTVGRLRDLVDLACGRLDGRGRSDPSLSIRTAGRVTVASAHPVPVQLDGDAFGCTPVVVESDGPEIRLIMPE